jgi:hypothetical protein
MATVTVVFMTQPVLGGDFMAFYTSGRLALRGDWTGQYDWPAFHGLQMSLVPDSSPYHYPQSYPPLVPALYAPFAMLSFRAAFVAWLVLSTLRYASLAAVAARGSKQIRPAHVVLAALVFPPFVAHQVLGQSTVWPLIGFVGGWWAMTAGRPLTAGAALSLIAIKPHLGIALAVVVLAMRLWRVVAGIALGCAVHAVLSVAVCGTSAVAAYIRTTITVLRNPGIIEAIDPRHLHALRTSLEHILPEGLAGAGWVVASSFFAWITLLVWRRTDDWALRFATLLLATLLISPHVQTYDAILLAPAVLWLADRALLGHRPHLIVELAVLSVIFLMPAAKVAGIPLTIPLMTWILWECRGAPDWSLTRPEVSASSAPET